ncbi:hypothetical protein MTR67_038473 [Solanum verrucosum]|uniref:Uncharacterized protein n=1 Tax=Solanum verrucosum TaxID=315347 RepID=A0AAF0UFX7_SOLVR|nr:hypothetical protein MTR67_038473 [Solanum verrucosum]
MQTYFNFLKR